MGASFDLWQQVFSLSYMANAASGQTGEASAIAQSLDNTLSNFFASSATQSAIGSWRIVWGPVVFEHAPGPTSYADNAMYVAANADNSEYVVAIAATNSHSDYDWDDEDFDVETTVAWTAAFPSLAPYGVPSHSPSLSPSISSATALGVNNLLGMIDTIQGTNQDLVSFLGALPTATTQAAQISFAGHSLAGALSPTLALALFNPNGGKLSQADWQTVAVYPTAGATPGNADFATFFSAVLPPVAATSSKLPYQTWNQDTWNTIDVVPHAWEIATLSQIPTLYPSSWIITPLKLTAGVDWAKHRSNEGAGTMNGPYTKIANNALVGTYQGVPVANLDAFEAEALYQHTTAYEVLLNVQGLFPADLKNAFKSALSTVLQQPVDPKA
jgi:hypothetical protein